MENPAGEGAGTLWIVATPIGSLGDMGDRAREVLARVDTILAEDTRRTRGLLSDAGIPAAGRLRSLHEHNEDRAVPGIVEALHDGRSVALVSDAGTPVLSDPGFLLVRQARAEGLKVCSVPGPSSFAAALAASAQPPLPATLVGFLPHRKGPRRRRVEELAQMPWTLVVLLSRHRLRPELEDLARGLGGGRPATLLAELSKVHERAVMGSLDELRQGDEAAAPRGEYVIVIGPKATPPGSAPAPNHVRAAYQDEIAYGLSRPDALRTVARRLGISRKQVYGLLLEDPEAEDDGGGTA